MGLTSQVWGWGGQGKRELTPASYMATKARSQDPATPFGLPTWVAGSQTQGTSSAVFPGASAGGCIRSRAARTPTSSHMGHCHHRWWLVFQCHYLTQEDQNVKIPPNLSLCEVLKYSLKSSTIWVKERLDLRYHPMSRNGENVQHPAP